MGELTPAHKRAYERLKKVRASKTVSLKPCSLLRDTITGFDGKPTPFKLRYYQVQAVYHMLVLKRMVLGEDTGLGKTIETIAALCYLWENNEAANKVIVVAPKSAMRQWAGELERFAKGVKAIVAGSRAPNPVADCTCTVCKHEWQTKKTGKDICCPKCDVKCPEHKGRKTKKKCEQCKGTGYTFRTAWCKAQKDDNGAIIAPEPITVVRESPVDVRQEDYAEWAKPYQEGEPRKVLITNYALLVRDWNHGGFQPPTDSGDPDYKKPVIPGLLDKTTASVGKDTVVIFDECTAFKSMRTKTWEYADFLSRRAHRVYGLTATLLKNRLMEGYCIYRAIKPGVFTTKTKFYEDFCYIELKRVKGNRRIPVVLGYKNLERFREQIDPVFLGRKKHMVSDELPTLTTREVTVELSSPEDAKYGEALSGILELGDGDIKDYDENKALVSLTYCQQVVDSLRLLKFDEGDEIESGMAFDPRKMKVGKLGTKEQALVDLITGELDEEKLIVYTRFASLVPRLQAILKREGVKSVAITGKVSGKKRAAAQDKFQDLESDTKVMFITAAGTEALNLQAAIATVFYDLPWSWGDYLQALGRMIRIGSPHQKVLAYHLVAYRPNRSKKDSKTIDHHVLGLLRSKRNFIDKILGEGAVGALKFDRSSSIIELVRQMQEDAKSDGKSV